MGTNVLQGPVVIIRVDSGSSRFLWNVGTIVPDRAASYPRRAVFKAGESYARECIAAVFCVAVIKVASCTGRLRWWNVWYGWLDWYAWTHVRSAQLSAQLCTLFPTFVLHVSDVNSLLQVVDKIIRKSIFLCSIITVMVGSQRFNPLTPNDLYRGRTAPLTTKLCILYIYSSNICTEYFKHGIYSVFSLQNTVGFIILMYLVPVLFTFYIQGVPKLKK